jgi:DNA-binding NarL/FixJ family response regulator
VISVLLADDQALVRSGFRLILDVHPDITVVGEAADGVAAVAATRRLKPDVVLMDIQMPDLDGIEATRQIATGGSSPRVLVLTTYDADEYLYDAIRAGASGFLLKDATRDQLVSAIRTVASGEALLHPSLTRRLLDTFTRGPRPGTLPQALNRLSDREVDVLRLIGRGQSNAEIAGTLFLSEATVKTHLAHILQKLGLRDRVQAVVLAYDCGLIQPRP